MFSKACEYGIRAAVYIAHQSETGHRVGLKDIASAIDSPEAFTAKILQQLVKSDLVCSTKGPAGGFEMTAHHLDTVMVSDIVKTIDSDLVYTGCGLGLSVCSEESPCPLHHEFMDIREQLRTMLETTSIYHLAQSLATGNTILKR